MVHSRSVLVSIPLSFLLGACGQEAPQAQEPPPAPAVTVAVSEVVGDWAVEPVCMSNLAFNIVKRQVERQLEENPGFTITDSQIDEALQPHLREWQVTPPLFTFKEDKTFGLKAGKETVNGTWTLEGDIVTVSVNGETRAQYRVIENYLSNVLVDDTRRPVHLIRK